MLKNKEKKYGNWLNRIKLGMRVKLISIFLIENLIPVVLLVIIAWMQIGYLGASLRDIAVADSTKALNDRAVENIERLSTDGATKVADFLYGRDNDVKYLAQVTARTYMRHSGSGDFYGTLEEVYGDYVNLNTGRIIEPGEWDVSPETGIWVPVNRADSETGETEGRSTNPDNDDDDRFHYRPQDDISYVDVPLYDEIVFIEALQSANVAYARVQALPDSNALTDSAKVFMKSRSPMPVLTGGAPVNMGATNSYGNYINTYVKAEKYFNKLPSLHYGDIYVSDVIGEYIGTNHLGMYTEATLTAAKKTYEPEEQAFSGGENPLGKRFEGIVRWITPVTDDGTESGDIIGYVSIALNHAHLSELVDHITPMDNRYEELSSAHEGNYAFIWDYECRSIVHPRHHSVYGFDKTTGEAQTPWLSQDLYDEWQAASKSSVAAGGEAIPWNTYKQDVTIFNNQSRSKKAAAELTAQKLMGLDGRYLNHAPQCTGWMDLTKDGGSGSFLILWTGLYKLTTAAAIPYYTGQYAPSSDNDFSRRGFGFVAIGAGFDDFNEAAAITAATLNDEVNSNLTDAIYSFAVAVIMIIIIMSLITILVSSSITSNITGLVNGISRYKSGERQFRFNTDARDEFGSIAVSFNDMADSIENSVKNPLSIIDMNRRIIYMNERGLKATGMTLERVVGNFYGENSIYPEHTVYDPIIALESAREAEIYYHEPSASYYKGIANHLHDKDGNKVGYIIESIDMTEIVLDQTAKEEQRMLLDKVISASPDLIWYVDTQSRYVIVNPRFAAVAQRRAEEIIGKCGNDVLPESMAKEFVANDAEAFNLCIPLYKEECMQLADNREEVFESVRVPIFDATGALSGILGYARTVTVRVQMETRLRQAQIELEKAVAAANLANNHKGDFLARMSHEIRTPMNAIIGITNIILKKLEEPSSECDAAEMKQKMRQIESSSQHLLGLLNDILDISKIEAGKIELAEEKMSVNELADTVCTIIKPRCDDKNIRFDRDIDDFGETAFIGDSLRLRQVLINLLGNAVKFTPECGRIGLEIKRIEQSNNRSLIKFTVTDTGIGISNEAKEHIFRPFEQANKNVSAKYGGTGLGLAISSNIVKLFGGEIQVESVPGEGSSFSFSVWMTETEQEAKSCPIENNSFEKIKGKNILLVDDVEINRMIVCSLLEDTGAIITEADDGLTAIEAFEDSPEGYFDIILMDIKMTHMDGYRATKMLRGMDRADAKTIPIIALTANAFKDDIDEALASGMNAHIAKPVEYDSLIKVLFKFL